MIIFFNYIPDTDREREKNDYHYSYKLVIMRSDMIYIYKNRYIIYIVFYDISYFRSTYRIDFDNIMTAILLLSLVMI